MEQRYLRLIAESDPDYAAVCRLINQKFSLTYDTKIQRRPNLTLALTETREGAAEIVASAALNAGHDGPFFSEYYLGESAETSIAKVTGQPVERSDIIEVGGLAAQGGGAGGAYLVGYAPWFLLGLGFRYALVTATDQVQAIFKRVGIVFTPIVDATVEALPEEQRELWGSYYERSPVTGVIDLLASHQAISTKRRRTYVIDEMTMTTRKRQVG